MQLERYKIYKDYIIYIDSENNWYIVYDDKKDEIIRKAIQLSVDNDIDVDIPILAYRSSESLTKLEIDVHEIISRC